MGWVVGITIVVMVVYSLMGGEAEKRGAWTEQASAQGVIDFGWWVLGGCGLLWLLG